MLNTAIEVPDARLTEYCRRWKIEELALFGSALRSDFGPESDVDVLAAYLPGADWSLLDHIQMQNELAELLGRPVDLVSRKAVERSDNPIRRRAILESARAIYSA